VGNTPWQTEGQAPPYDKKKGGGKKRGELLAGGESWGEVQRKERKCAKSRERQEEGGEKEHRAPSRIY